MKKTIYLIQLLLLVSFFTQLQAQEVFTSSRRETLAAKEGKELTADEMQASRKNRNVRYKEYSKNPAIYKHNQIIIDSDSDVVFLEIDSSNKKTSLPVYGNGLRKDTLEMLKAILLSKNLNVYDLKGYCPPIHPTIFVVRSKEYEKVERSDSGEISMKYVDINGEPVSEEEARKECGWTTPPPPPPTPTPDPIRIPMYGTLFHLDKATLTDSAKRMITRTVNNLNDRFSSYNLMIEGHTDTRASDSYNMTLSSKRANAVKKFILDNLSLPKYRISAEGFGERRLKNTRNGHSSENRRVEFVVQDYIARQKTRE